MICVYFIQEIETRSISRGVWAGALRKGRKGSQERVDSDIEQVTVFGQLKLSLAKNSGDHVDIPRS